MLNLLKGFAQDVVVTEANTVRAISSKDLLNKVNSIANFSKEIFEQKNSKNALDLAVEIAKRKSGSSGVIVLGSIALAGEILQHSKSI